ncbi:hypothetical protein CEP51_009322 [Fusarium floridanum]|uniref:Uncharacterized protein n=1 Tax=Fusarium floridanum TaxID=1325733 RepID=A0A428RI26_9HYPO|nr:hypothetical protein CEP51_009322 [Fusarium floridanum]
MSRRAPTPEFRDRNPAETELHRTENKATEKATGDIPADHDPDQTDDDDDANDQPQLPPQPLPVDPAANQQDGDSVSAEPHETSLHTGTYPQRSTHVDEHDRERKNQAESDPSNSHYENAKRYVSCALESTPLDPHDSSKRP